MLSSDYLFTIADTISEMYEELNTSIINDMARRISKMDYASETTIWQAQRAIESGALYDDIVKRISEQTGKSQEELQKIFKEAGIENLKNNLRMAGMPVNDMKISERTANILISGLNKTGGVLKNLTLTTAIDTQNQFIYATDLAYSQLISGAFDYNTVIRRTIKELASQGICTVDYKTGYRQKIDSAVRSVVLTGVNQTTGPMTEMQRLEVGADGYETTAHGGARPEHQLWQGKQFYADIPVKGYEDFKTVTGYGTVTGLKGANCRHDFFWVFLGKDKPSYTTSELKALNDKTVEYNGKKMTVYDAQSKMRKIERTVRAWKRQSNALRTAGLDNSFEKQKVKEWTNKYKDFTSKTGLRNQNERLVVYTPKNEMTKLKNDDIMHPNYIRKNVVTGYNADKEENTIKSAVKMMPENLRKRLEIEEFEIITKDMTDKNISRYDRKNNKFYIYEDSTEEEVIHEIGHYVETKYNVLNDSKYIRIRQKGIKNYSIYSVRDLPNYNGAVGITNSKFISEQQGRIYKKDLNAKSYIANNQKINLNCLGEYFSEGFREYWVNRENLRKHDTELFDYIKEVLEKC